jgi:hypothetical protein
VGEGQGWTKVFISFLCIWTDKKQMLFIFYLPQIAASTKPLLLIRQGASQVQFCFVQWANLTGPWNYLLKKKNYGGSPKQKVLSWNIKFFPLVHLHVGEKRTTVAKAYGIKVKCYWELFGGTSQELLELFTKMFYYPCLWVNQQLHWLLTLILLIKILKTLSFWVFTKH